MISEASYLNVGDDDYFPTSDEYLLQKHRFSR